VSTKNEAAIEWSGEIDQQRMRSFIPYGRQWVDEDHIAAVVQVLRQDFIVDTLTKVIQ
jgi:hypothetical protein